MNIFSPNYLYKIKLIGYTVKETTNNNALTRLYFKSHHQIYKLEYNQYLGSIELIKNPDIEEIYKCSTIGLYKDNILDFKNTSIKELVFEDYDFLVQQIIKILFAKSKNIISSKAFVVDFDKNKLLVNPEQFTFVDANKLISAF